MSGCLSCSDRLFHSVGPAVAKEQSRNWLHDLLTTHVRLSADRKGRQPAAVTSVPAVTICRLSVGWSVIEWWCHTWSKYNFPAEALWQRFAIKSWVLKYILQNWSRQANCWIYVQDGFCKIASVTWFLIDIDFQHRFGYSELETWM